MQLSRWIHRWGATALVRWEGAEGQGDSPAASAHHLRVLADIEAMRDPAGHPEETKKVEEVPHPLD